MKSRILKRYRTLGRLGAAIAMIAFAPATATSPNAAPAETPPKPKETPGIATPPKPLAQPQVKPQAAPKATPGIAVPPKPKDASPKNASSKDASSKTASPAAAKSKPQPKATSKAASGSASKTVPLPRPRPVAGGETRPAASAAPPAVSARPAPVAAPSRPSVPLAMSSTEATSPADLATVKKAIELARKGKTTEATELAKLTSDSAARKLIDWVVLRAEDDVFNFERYANFVATNPGWPSLMQFRRKAEAALYQNGAGDAVVRSHFASSKPTTAKGRFAMARALLAQGERALAQQYAREAWRNDSFSSDIEKKALDAFGPLLTGGDHKARMDRRLYAENTDEAMRAAQRLGATEIAIAKARIAVINKASNTKALLDAVPQDGRRDAGYMFSRIQWLRRNDKIAEAGELMLSAPNAPSAIHDVDEWWTERRLLARKLLDIGDPQSAFKVAAAAALPEKENARVEQLFTAGWIALRFLNDPGAAMPFFARIVQVAEHPASLARAAYWQGRTAEALGRRDDAARHFERAAQYPTAYYGQIARGRIGAGDTRLSTPPAPAAHTARLEIVRAIDILYAVDERDLVASAVADLADKTTDIGALAAIAALTERYDDPRSTVLLGRTAVGRGLPFEAYAYPVKGLPRYNPVGPQVEPQMAYSIARQESGFNPRAVSSANALGLMQVTPAAGKYIAKKNGIAFDQKRLLNDPVYNVQMGAAELGDVIEAYRGSYILAFVAYNAGRGRVREWIGRYGDPRDAKVDPVDWVERIPFSETRNYVQRVLENLQVYRMRFGGSAKPMIEADLRRGMVAN